MAPCIHLARARARARTRGAGAAAPAAHRGVAPSGVRGLRGAVQTLYGVALGPIVDRVGLVRSLGVSNYAVEDFQELMASATVTPAINQIEINPFLYRKNTIGFFESQGVKLQSYRALRDGKAFDDPTVVGLAQKHGRSAAQILGRWCVQKGFIYIPKSVKRERMADNMAVFDFELAADDVAALDALTTPAAIEKFKELYVKCVLRDTPDAGRAAALAREKVTLD